MRDENLRTVREQVLREREELRARAQALEKKEMMMELEKTQQAEGQWRSKVVKMEEEQEVKLKDLLREIKRLKEREKEMEKKWMSRLQEVKREVEESQAEHSSTISSSTRFTVMAAMLEKQKTQISSLAAEVMTEQEVVDRQSRETETERETEDKKEKSGGQVSRRGISFNRQNKECKT